MRHWSPLGKPLAAVLLIPLILTACLFLPGKFDSTLTIHADRSFTFTYKGEVLAADMNGLSDMGKLGSGDMMDANATEAVDAASDIAENSTDATTDNMAAEPAEDPVQKAKEDAEKKAKQDEEYRDLAAKLAKEAGYKSVEYRGDGVFYVDYAISGVLTHNFVYPYDLDAAMIFPWLAVELRGKDMVRVKAPGFAKQDSSMTGMAGANSQAQESKMDGTFTLITDAEVVSQNDEDGSETPGKTKTFRWKITPRTQDAPMATLRVKGI